MSPSLTDPALCPPLFLALLAGITDLTFRDPVSRFGAGPAVSGMVASRDMVQARPGLRERAEPGFGSANTAVQFAGREARWMAEPARLPCLARITFQNHHGHRVISGRTEATMRAAKPPKPSRTAGMTAIPASPAPRPLRTTGSAMERTKAA